MNRIKAPWGANPRVKDLHQPFLSQALANLRKGRTSLHTIDKAFFCDGTLQGEDYWRDIHEGYYPSGYNPDGTKQVDPPALTHTGSKYLREIGRNDSGRSDVYDVLKAFEVVCPARQHAIKKLLCAGLRGKGGEAQDLTEALDAVRRAVELNGTNQNV